MRPRDSVAGSGSDSDLLKASKLVFSERLTWEQVHHLCCVLVEFSISESDICAYVYELWVIWWKATEFVEKDVFLGYSLVWSWFRLLSTSFTRISRKKTKSHRARVGHSCSAGPDPAGASWRLVAKEILFDSYCLPSFQQSSSNFTCSQDLTSKSDQTRSNSKSRSYHQVNWCQLANDIHQLLVFHGL